MVITKADGTREEFDPRKLETSLKKAGAPAEVAKLVVREVERELHEGMSTSEIYSRAFAYLRHEHHGTAARYSLKRAVLGFGPSGFPFEAYVAELFRAEGYEATIDQIVKGACVEHEVDVVMRKNGETTYVEAKFHNTLGFKTDLKTVLYVKARIDDIAALNPQGTRGLVVTNTVFTEKATQYSQCEQLELLSWNYPQGRTLHTRIDKAGIYPVTALTSLNRHQKMALLQEKQVLCATLPQNIGVLERAGVRGEKIGAVLKEAGALCIPGNDI